MGTQVFVFAPRDRGASLTTVAISISVIAVLVIVLCPTVMAQMHGMRAMGRPVRVGIGPQVRPGFSVSRAGVIGAHPIGHRPFLGQRFPSRHHRHLSFFLAKACFDDPFFDPFLCRRFLFRNSLLFSQPLLLPFPVYSETSYAAPEESVSAEDYEQADLSGRIDRLTNEVERLRQEQESVNSPEQTPRQGQQVSEANPPARILVFRDGHRSEINNYVVVGNTLWVLTQERARRIPVSDLDMSATKKANADHGIEFP